MKIYKCQYCKFSAIESSSNKRGRSAKWSLGYHYDTVHKKLLPNDMSGYQWAYYTITGKTHGKCIICESSTSFNESTMKYSRFCNNPQCKQKYREQFKNRMLGKYGKIHLLDDPEKQKEMLSNRRISGQYQWSDMSVKIPFVGSYELHFLKFLDLHLQWRASDILSPSPHTYVYRYEDKNHFYIPDFFIASIKTEIEIKDDGSAKHISQVSRAKDIIKENIMKSNTHFGYIKIVNKKYDEFLNLVKEESKNVTHVR